MYAVVRGEPSLEDIWKVIERYGIKREIFQTSHPTDEDILELYRLIKKQIRDRRDKETIRRLREYIEKLKQKN